VKHYLWRAVDHEGEVLESFVTKRGDKKAALKFLRKSLRRHGQTETIVTDRLASYGAALKALGATGPSAPGSINARRSGSSRLASTRKAALSTVRIVLRSARPRTDAISSSSDRNRSSSGRENHSDDTRPMRSPFDTSTL
jgi:putative transposase